MIDSFDQTTLRNLSNLISDMLSHKQITERFASLGFIEAENGTNKQDRIYYTFNDKQIQDKCANNVLSFVANLLNPKRYDDETNHENHRTKINEKLLYEGIEINERGEVKKVHKARTISEAKERSLKIKQKVHGIGIHAEIIPYCEEEWLKENYFHAILEITKSVAERLRQKSQYKTDGTILIDECFGLGKEKQPMLAFNKLQTPSDESEHKGFANLCKGFFSMYRNPKAHNPKILEQTQLTEMTEVIVIATILHKKIDLTFKTGYK